MLDVSCFMVTYVSDVPDVPDVYEFLYVCGVHDGVTTSHGFAILESWMHRHLMDISCRESELRCMG